MGYRRIRDELARCYGLVVNDKRVLRLCRELQIQSTIKHQGNSITTRALRPFHTASNRLNRNFHAEKPNEKWLTDVTEFKYKVHQVVHKVYLSLGRFSSSIIRTCLS